MPWKCPACELALEHRHRDDLPTVGMLYRCPVCHLNLVFDPQVQKLRPALKTDTPRPNPGRTA